MAVIRLDKIAGQHLASIKAPQELTNGLFLQLGALVEGETELREASTPTDVEKAVVVLHATPEVDPDPRKAGLKHFRVAQGGEGRGYHMSVGDIITLTEDLFGSTPTVGDIVGTQNGSMKLDVLEEDANPRLQFMVIEETTLGYDADKAFAIEAVRV